MEIIVCKFKTNKKSIFRQTAQFKLLNIPPDKLQDILPVKNPTNNPTLVIV